MLATHAEDLGDVLIVETVERQASLLPIADDFHLPQLAEVVAHRRLTGFRDDRQIPDAHLAVGEGLHDPQSGRVRQDLERICEIGQGYVGGASTPCLADGLRV